MKGSCLKTYLDLFVIVKIMTKTAIITGAAKNIGKGIAKTLLAEGYKCILLDIHTESLRKTTEELGSGTGQCLEYVIDIGDTGAIEKFMEWLTQNAYQIDVLVNNVGYESEKTVLSLTVDALVQSNAVNIAGPYYLTSLIANTMSMDKIKGNIIFVTSTHSSVTRMHPLYSSSKAAIEMFMKEAALELAPKHIRVNAVAPGPVEDTSMPNANSYVPMGISQQPQDVAECVSFLVSDKARFITGQTITVDGGFSIAHTHFWKNQERL